MGKTDTIEAAGERGRRRGESAAREAIESGAATWQDFDAPAVPGVSIHPELGVPIQVLPKAILRLGTAEERAELESFVRSYNAEIMAAHAAGKLRDFRPRLLTAEAFEQRFAEGSALRLLRNGKATSPDGRYVLASSSKWRQVTLQGPDDESPHQLEDDLDADFLFLADGETLLVRTLYAHYLVDLPTRIRFSYQKRRDEDRLAGEKRKAEDRERRRCTTRWSGDGGRIERRELTELRLEPGAVAEDVHLEGCTLLDGRAGARPRSDTLRDWSAARATIRNMTLTRCELVRCGASNVLFENVVLDRTKLGFGTALNACLFDRVTLRGDIGAFELWYEAHHAGPALGAVGAVPDAIRNAHTSFYDKVSWALDLTGLKSGRIHIGDIPVELVRVNPELCFVMRREHAMSDDFQKVEGVEYTNITNDVWAFRRTTRSSLLLVANPRAKSFKLDIAALRNLRRAGLVT